MQHPTKKMKATHYVIKPLYVVLLGTALLAAGCQAPPSGLREAAPTAAPVAAKPLVERVLTAEEQQQLTPAAILASLRAGNERFTQGDLTLRDHAKLVRLAASGQYPKAVVLSCLDSRIPVEDVFDRGIGDLFVARVAGNIVNEDILGSMEFGCRVAGAKVILVLGHKHCGAVKSAIDNVQLGNVTALLAKIRPAVAGVKDFAGEQSAQNAAYVEAVAKTNVRLMMQTIRARSPILQALETKGALQIVGAYYDLDTGAVAWLEP